MHIPVPTIFQIQFGLKLIFTEQLFLSLGDVIVVINQNVSKWTLNAITKLQYLVNKTVKIYDNILSMLEYF